VVALRASAGRAELQQPGESPGSAAAGRLSPQLPITYGACAGRCTWQATVDGHGTGAPTSSSLRRNGFETRAAVAFGRMDGKTRPVLAPAVRRGREGKGNEGLTGSGLDGGRRGSPSGLKNFEVSPAAYRKSTGEGSRDGVTGAALAEVVGGLPNEGKKRNDARGGLLRAWSSVSATCSAAD
jgi:hypothetical protein